MLEAGLSRSNRFPERDGFRQMADHWHTQLARNFGEQKIGWPRDAVVDFQIIDPPAVHRGELCSPFPLVSFRDHRNKSWLHPQNAD